MTFNKWLDTFLSEKGIQLDQAFYVEGPSGLNRMEVIHVVEAIKAASKLEQAAIKGTMIKINFRNGDILLYMHHLAKALAI